MENKTWCIPSFIYIFELNNVLKWKESDEMNRLMLTISAGEWEGIQHRPHHFMKRSANSGWTVLYVEPPASWIAPIKNKAMFNRWKKWLKGLVRINDNLYTIAPPPVLPFSNKYRTINKLNQFIIARTIKNAIKHFKGYEVDLYSFLPNAIDLLPSFAFHRIIYDCVDDHASFSGFIKREVILKMEKDLMEKADVSFATARQLMVERKDWTSNFHLIPNGAEFEHFSKAQDNKLIVPQDLPMGNKPIVGFIGGISDWIDIPLLTKVAKQMNDIQFVFIGPVATNIVRLKELPNVTMLGPKPYDELPSYLKGFDSCLIPFKINKLTEAVNPIKLYEYLSAGKPIVSTPLPEVIPYEDFIEIAQHEDEMMEAIRKTIDISEKNLERIGVRQKIGAENSWDARWEMVKSLIKAE